MKKVITIIMIWVTLSSFSILSCAITDDEYNALDSDSKLLYDEAHYDGYEVGHEEGYGEGYNEGYDDGYESGYLDANVEPIKKDDDDKPQKSIFSTIISVICCILIIVWWGGIFGFLLWFLFSSLIDKIKKSFKKE